MGLLHFQTHNFPPSPFSLPPSQPHFPPLISFPPPQSHIGRERKDNLKYDFSFDRVFQPSASQEEVFEEISMLVQVLLLPQSPPSCP